jgi:tetratricopeptide (TPR) repeat protein
LGADESARFTTDDAIAKLETAQHQFTAARYTEAESVAREVIAMTADAAVLSGAIDVIVLCRLSQGDFDGAKQAAEGLKGGIANPTIQSYLDKWTADVQAKQAAYDQTIASLEATLKAHAGDESGADAAYRIGVTEVFWGRSAQALAAFGRVVNEFSFSNRALPARLAMGDIHERAGRYAEAEALYAEIIHRAANSLCAAQAVARIKAARLAQGDAAGASRRMEEIVRAFPKTESAARAQFCIGEIHAMRAETIEAEAAFVSATREYGFSSVAREAKATLAQMYYPLAAATLGEEDLASALDNWRKAAHVDTDPVRRAETLYRIATVCLQLGRYEEARAAAGEILKEKSPAYAKWHEATREFVATTYYREGQYAEALTRFEALLAGCKEAERQKALQAMITQIKSDIERPRQAAAQE